MKKLSIILFGVLFILILGYLGFRFFSPFGKTVNYSFTSKLPGSEVITNFSPSKDNVLKIPTQIIKTSQVRFTLDLLSKDIQSVKAAIKFKTGPKEIKLGVRGNEKDSFIYRPLYNSSIQNLTWSKIEEGQYTLWQRQKKYVTLNGFFNNPPSSDKIVHYFFDQKNIPLLKQTGSKVEKYITFDNALRGNHILLINVAGQSLILKVSKQDLNIYDGEDKYKISILKDGKILSTKTIGDDGITDQSKIIMAPQQGIITLNDITSGVYQANIFYEGKGFDSLITKIEVNQPLVVFKGYVSNWGDKTLVLWTDIKKIDITSSGENPVTIKLDEKNDLSISSKGKVFNFDLETIAGKKEKGTLYKLDIPKSYMSLSGIGSFAFSQEAFFNPELKTITSTDNLDNSDYILTTYRKPKAEGNWLIAETEFDPKTINGNTGKLFFSLESPELNNYGGELEIDYLEITARSKGALGGEVKDQYVSTPPVEKITLFQKIKAKISGIFNTITNFFGGLFGRNENGTLKKGEITPKPNFKLTITPTKSRIISPSPTPSIVISPTVKAFTVITPAPTTTLKTKQNISVKVLNGGAEAGAASKFTEILKKEGFSKVEASNAGSLVYKNTQIEFSEQDRILVNEIVLLLEKDYKNINKISSTTRSGEITIILGSD